MDLPTQNLIWILGLMMPHKHYEDTKRLVTHTRGFLGRAHRVASRSGNGLREQGKQICLGGGERERKREGEIERERDKG